MKRLCVCGHRKYKHSNYPLDMNYCKGNKVSETGWFGCPCSWYEPIGNLEYLEEKYQKLVVKNKKL